MNSYPDNQQGEILNIRAMFASFAVRNLQFAAVLVLLASLQLLPANAHAAAGDTITSTATINYVIGGVPGSGSASASFVEDRYLNFTVSAANGGSAVPVISSMSNAVLQFNVSNTANADMDFLLTALNTSPNPFGLPPDSFDPLPGTVRVFVESGATPGYQPGEDTAVFIDELPAGATRMAYVVADMPALVVDDVAAMALVAQIAEGGTPGVEGAAINADDNGHVSPAGVFSNGGTSVPTGIANNIPNDPNSMQSVFNDPAGLDPEDISTDLNQDIAQNGQHSDAGAWQQTSPVVINKSVTVIDTQGGTDPHPGATLRYQLEVGIAGNVAIDNLVISDVIPANTTYTDGSITLNGVAQTDANDPPVDYSQAIDILNKPVTSIEVDLSQGGSLAVPPGSTNTIVFDVTIN